MQALGDVHNFGRRVTKSNGIIVKPRTLYWEELFLSEHSLLRRTLNNVFQEAETKSPLESFPNLHFAHNSNYTGGTVTELCLLPLHELESSEFNQFAYSIGQLIALSCWFGITDLHKDNIKTGIQKPRKFVACPIDIETIFENVKLPSQTLLIHNKNEPEIPKNKLGIQPIKPLQKPDDTPRILPIIDGFWTTSEILETSRKRLLDSVFKSPTAFEAPIRYIHRSTLTYHQIASGELKAPENLLSEELAQLNRGDIPYFFRYLDDPNIYYFADNALKNKLTVNLTQNQTVSLPTTASLYNLHPTPEQYAASALQIARSMSEDCYNYNETSQRFRLVINKEKITIESNSNGKYECRK